MFQPGFFYRYECVLNKKAGKHVRELGVIWRSRKTYL